MGRLVALLSDEDRIGPAPDLSLVEELVARASGSGLDVALRLEGEREGLPAPVVQACYRVVQEGLTNALRYAAGAAVSVVVRGERDALLVEVANGPATSAPALAGTGTGSGLIGLRQRVAESGGAVEAGRPRMAAACSEPGGGLAIRPALPLATSLRCQPCAGVSSIRVSAESGPRHAAGTSIPAASAGAPAQISSRL